MLFSVQFWTISNAEWTMKSALDFTDRIVDCFFSQEIFLLAYCLTANGRLWKFEMNRAYDCADGVAVSVSASEFLHKNLIWMNLETLRFSDYNKAPIPPPMCHFAIDLPSNNGSDYEFVSSISLNPNGELAVFSSSNNLYFCEFVI